MLKTVDIRKTALSKAEFAKVVNTEFKTFVKEQPEALEDRLDEFFRLYEDLYFQIPVEGAFKSHTYLVERSSELVKVEQDETVIQPLLDEIAQLREQLLLANEQLLDMQTNQVNSR